MNMVRDTEVETMSNGARFISPRGVQLCFETFGSPDDPAILLIHGAGTSMLGWEAALCERLAAGGRFVIRYDQRDTGLSENYPPGRPGYALSDLTQDALAILDDLNIERAHIVGRSLAGAITLGIGVDFPHRAKTLTFVTTTPGDDDLLFPDDLERYTSQNLDFADKGAVSDYLVGLLRVFSGTSPYFEEDTVRKLAEAEVGRTRDMAAALTNHFCIAFDGPASGGLSDIRLPTLVVHGERDPVFPLVHGERLRDTVPGATLLVLPEAGHEVPKQLWDLFVATLVAHTNS